MAVEQGFFQPEAQFESDGDVSPKQEWDTINSSKDSCNVGCGFDCNICLETAHDPVVTLCGHLYCWPCIYKWLHVQGSSPDANHQKQDCPICKSNISLNALVPLYGHGASPSVSETKMPQLPRPPPPAMNALITSASSTSLRSRQFNPHLFQTQSFYDRQYFANPHGGTTTTSLLNPTIVMLGELVFERVFGMTDMRLFPHPNSYNLRMRRQDMQLDKSLSRLSIFFFCCLIICLLLF